MKSFQSIKLLDRFKRLFEKAGIDYPILRKILKIKLTMDQRRVPTIFQQSQKNKKKEVNYFLRSLWLYSLMGLILIPFILMGDNYIFQMSIVFAITMFFIMTTMISDFSSVLLDLRDNTILSTKPINKKTIHAAKLIHISIYMFLLTASIVAIPSIVALIKHGLLFFSIFIVAMIFINLFIMVFTAILYLLLLKIFDGERLKDVINYFQILLSIAMMIGYQLVAHSFDFIEMKVTFSIKWWHFFIPPIWYSVPFEWLLHQQTERVFVAFTTLALLIPILSIFFYIKHMPAFEKNLQKLTEQSKGKKETRGIFSQRLAKIICRTKEERTFYRFASIMIKNEREFKLKVYPSIGFSIILPFIMIYNSLSQKSLEEIASSQSFFYIYFSMMIIPTVIMMLKYSGKYQGAWIYITTPIHNKAAIYKGTLKAFLVNLFLPVFLLISLLFSLIYGIQLIPHLVIVMLSAFIYTVICFQTIKGSYPFSQSFNTIQQGGNMIILPLMIFIGLFVVLHFVSTLFHYGIYLYMVALIFVNLYSWRKFVN